MSLDIKLQMRAASGDAQQLACDALERLLPQCTSCRIEIIDNLMRVQSVEQVGLPNPNLVKALRHFQVPQRGRCDIGVTYALTRGSPLGLSLLISGPEFTTIVNPSTVEISTTSDLLARWHSHSALEEDGDSGQWGEEQYLNEDPHSSQAVLFRRGMTESWNNAEELFCRACGLLEIESGREVVSHASFFCGDELLSPMSPFIIYHRDVADFASDFMRIYLHARDCRFAPDCIYGLSHTELLSLGAETKQGLEEDPWLYIERMRPMVLPHQRDHALASFLTRLDLACAEQLSTIKPAVIRELFRQATIESGYARITDFGSNGMIISTHPLTNLRHIYLRVAELSKVMPSI